MTKKEIRHYVVCNLKYTTTSILIKTKLYSKVITNLIESFYQSQRIGINPEKVIKNLNSHKKLHTFITFAFNWKDTPEGYEYWHKIYNYNYCYEIRI